MVLSGLIVLAIGFLVGVVLKKTVKLGLAIIALVGLLVATGYIKLNLGDTTKTMIYSVFSQAPAIVSQATSLANFLPITSAAFLVGLAIGIWKG